MDEVRRVARERGAEAAERGEHARRAGERRLEARGPKPGFAPDRAPRRRLDEQEAMVEVGLPLGIGDGAELRAAERRDGEEMERCAATARSRRGSSRRAP